MTKKVCATCLSRPPEFVQYPHFAAYNASGDRPRIEVCGYCAAELIESNLAERVGPFAIVCVDRARRMEEQRTS